jgi:hypothetical protein
MGPELGIHAAELGPDAEIVTNQRVNVALTKMDPAVSQKTYPPEDNASDASCPPVADSLCRPIARVTI